MLCLYPEVLQDPARKKVLAPNRASQADDDAEVAKERLSRKGTTFAQAIEGLESSAWCIRRRLAMAPPTTALARGRQGKRGLAPEAAQRKEHNKTPAPR